MRASTLRKVAALGAVAFGAGSCASDADSANGHATGVRGEVMVFAAASLTSAFTEIGDAFSSEHPDATVTFNFASSSSLAAQIREGAPADVFASADETSMDRAVTAGAAGEPEVFATNSLQIIVEAGNPKGITGVRDLDDPDVVYLTCAPEVPIGRYAQHVLDATGVTVAPASYEDDVKGIVTKVSLGEADAGIVYATDVIAAGDAAAGIDIPADAGVVARYPIAATTTGPNPPAAQAFVAFVLADRAQRILAGSGFAPP